MSKRAAVLFEILIALSLTAILLTFLFSFFVESAKIEKKLDTARMAVTMRGNLQTRLQSVLSSISHDQSEHLYVKQFEKEKSPSLIVIFDNGIDPDPAFSGDILGRIFLDSEKNLCLATWPLDKNKNRPWRKEVLLDRVDGFEFEFLGKKGVVEKEKIVAINETYAWRSSWSKLQSDIPSTIRLRVKVEGETYQFAFILPQVEPYVIYRETA